MNWGEVLATDPMLADPARQAEALTRNATRLLREKRPAEAARLLARRLRIEPPAAAAEHALAALAQDLSGLRTVAEETLRAAIRADPLDPAVGLAALRLARTDSDRCTAAGRLLASPDTPDDARMSALGALFAGGVTAVASFDLRDDALSGWVAWQGAAAPGLILLHPGGDETLVALTIDPGPGFAPSGSGLAFVATRVARPVSGYEIRRDAAVLASGRIAPRSRRGAPLPSPRAPAVTPEPRPLRIVIPIFADPDSAVEALRAALREARRLGGTELVAVDDASPDRALRALLEALADRGLVELRRNAINLGFTGAVTLGLDGLGDRDALILNSDAILPRGALERLRSVAYGAPDIGSVTPLSNNGEWTSLPRLGEAAPMPDAAQAERLDAAARAGSGGSVDLPNGIGFALYLRHDALQAAGGFSAVYERGYFEDAELTLRLRAGGFRNVAATGLVVPHHGSRSFGADKTLLVARNLRRLRRRFPALREESIGFRRADPLASARSGIERHAVPDADPILLVAPAGSALAAERWHRHEAARRPAVLLSWRVVGAGLVAELRGTGHDAPQSLRFDVATQGPSLTDWLARLDPSRLEVAGSPPPRPLLDAILEMRSAVSILAGDLPALMPDGAQLLDGFEAWRASWGERWLQAIASDRATLAALRRRLGGGADEGRIDADLATPSARAPESQAPARPFIAMVMGAPAPRSLAFAQRLQAAMRARFADAVGCAAFGATPDDHALIRCGVDAHGAVAPARLASRLLESGAAALLLPPSDPSLALFDRLADETALPAARLDWSEGAEARTEPNLLLPRNTGEPDIVHAVVDWFAGRLAP